MAVVDDAVDVIGMATQDAKCDFKPIRFKRRAPGDFDIVIDMLYCGVCHSDLHSAADHFKSLGFPAKYPHIPGHELSGVCTKVGAKVTKFKVGDHVGVGCMVDSCLDCKQCKAGHEQLCTKCDLGAIQTYQGQDKFGRAAVYPKGSHTMGGYSTTMVIQEKFAIYIPKSYPLECAGPVMCSGITMYEPLKTHGAKEGTRVGIVGLGGLGGIGIKIAKELGCSVTAISRGSSKADMAKQFGADNYLDSKSADQLLKAAGSLDLIINTIPVFHDTQPYEALLESAGILVMVGLTPTFLACFQTNPPKIKASLIGGIKNTEEVLEICDKAKIYPEVKIMPVQKLNEIFTMLDGSNDTGLRYVLDIKGTLSEKTFGTCNAAPPEISPADAMKMSNVLYELVRVNKSRIIKALIVAGCVVAVPIACLARRRANKSEL